MNRQKPCDPWLIALNDLREKSGMTYKEIADILKVSEKSVSRLFTGEAKKPDFFFVSQVIHTMGGSASEILGEAGAVVMTRDALVSQEQYDELKAAYDILLIENKALVQKNEELTAELIDVVKYFIKNPKE